MGLFHFYYSFQSAYFFMISRKERSEKIIYNICTYNVQSDLNPLNVQRMYVLTTYLLRLTTFLLFYFPLSAQNKGSSPVT